MRMMRCIPWSDRELGMPMNVAIYDPKLIDLEMPFGRLVSCHYEPTEGSKGDHQTSSLPGRMDVRLPEWVRDNDVVHIPLHGSPPFGPRLTSVSPDERLELYDEHLEIIRTISTTVRGILIGNDGPEFSMSHSTWRRTGSLERSERIDLMCEFVQKTSAEIISAGSRPYYATAPYDVAVDCYYGESRLRDTINECGGGQMCLGGQLLFGLGQHEGFLWPHQDHCCWQICPVNEPLPRSRLMEHVRGSNEFWSGVDYIRGMMAGNDIALSEIGFTEGIVGISSDWGYILGDIERWISYKANMSHHNMR